MSQNNTLASSERNSNPRSSFLKQTFNKVKTLLLNVLVVFIFPIYKVTHWLNKKYSYVGDHTFFDKQLFSWIPKVEAQAESIQKELDLLLKQKDKLPNLLEFEQAQKKATGEDDKWKAVFFMTYGNRIEETCKAFPNTAKVLEDIPGLKLAFFSILDGNKHINAHRGAFNGVLRYHLGLKIPGDGSQCRIRVGDDIRQWEQGGSLVFDDSFEHEVWNDSDEERVVLFVDFERPLPFIPRMLNRMILKVVSLFPVNERSQQLMSDTLAKLDEASSVETADFNKNRRVKPEQNLDDLDKAG